MNKEIQMNINKVDTLTFDMFGTILDLGRSMIPYLNEFLNNSNFDISSDQIWDTWRDRQRIEQYQDNILMLGHSGYLKTCERALKYSLEKYEISFNKTPGSTIIIPLLGFQLIILFIFDMFTIIFLSFNMTS